MENFKILVKDESESKEVQELFFELGYVWHDTKCKTQMRYVEPVYYSSFDDMELACDVSDVNYKHKEITLPELRDLVVLKRNDVGDATHVNSGGQKGYLTCENVEYFWNYFDKKWNKISLTFIGQGLKPITKEESMKEYLRKNSNGTYSYIGTVQPEHVSDFMIEIPEGSNIAVIEDSKVKFYSKYTSADLDHLGKDLIWMRPTLPEELPFIDDDFKLNIPEELKGRADLLSGRIIIDDEPSLGNSKIGRRAITVKIPVESLNDQYAEIEKVRQGMKYDSDKPRHSLLPKGAISSVIDVLEFGAKKYAPDNWQQVDNAKERYYNAAMRHIDLWWTGEKRDQETGIHHLAHAATNLFFLKWFDDKSL